MSQHLFPPAVIIQRRFQLRIEEDGGGGALTWFTSGIPSISARGRCTHSKVNLEQSNVSFKIKPQSVAQMLSRFGTDQWSI